MIFEIQKLRFLAFKFSLKQKKFKMSKKGLLIIAALILIGIVGFVSAQSSNPWAADSSGKEKNVFLTTESVYLASYTVCYAEGGASFDMYIIESKNLSSGDSLSDVRGSPQLIRTDSKGFIATTKIWSNITEGVYKIVLDCNNNKKYDSGEPVDSINAAGFSVGQIGTGTAVLGNNSPEDFSMAYSSDFTKENALLQIKLKAENEDVILKNLTLISNGTGSDNDVERVVVYVDADSNGKINNETIIGQAAFVNKQAIISLNYTLLDGSSVVLGVDYIMRNVTADKNYNFKADSLAGVGKDSKSTVVFTGFPMLSAVMSVGKALVCSGSLNLELSENIVFPNVSVTASISGLANCSGKTVYVKKGECASNDVLCSCNVTTGCDCDFISGIVGTYAISACVDKDTDGKYATDGEVSGTMLVVQKKPVVQNVTIQNVTTQNETVSLNQTSSGFLGLSSTNIIILLVVGMVFVFILLVVLMFMLYSLAKKK